MPKRSRVYKSPAIVLRQRRLGDTDKIITLYSEKYGKVDAVAKGVRRVTSRLAGHVEPLNHGSYLLARGRNLDIITQAQTIEVFQPLRDELPRLSHALYAAELMDRATEERATNAALYRLLLDTLRRLSVAEDLDLALRLFEVALLGELGYQPELSRCANCHGPVGEEKNSWAPAAGGVVCSTCRPSGMTLRAISSDALALLRLLQQKDRSVDGVRIASALGREVERHLREAIHYALDRDVRAAAFLEAVRRVDRGNAVRDTGPR